MFGMWHSVNVLLQYACKSSCCMTFYKWGGEAISEGVKVSPSPVWNSPCIFCEWVLLYCYSCPSLCPYTPLHSEDFGGSGEDVVMVEVQEYVGDPAYGTATTQLHKVLYDA